MVRALIEAGANVKMKDKQGTTAFNNAVEGNHEAVIGLLMEAGAKKIQELSQENLAIEEHIRTVEADLKRLCNE